MTTLKMTVRAEIARKAKEKAKAKDLSLSNYLCRLVERDLGADAEIFSREDLIRDVEEAKNGPVYHSADELFEKLDHEAANNS
jgi:hypothetical protein